MSASAWSNFKYPLVLAVFKFKKQTNISILEYKAMRLKSKFGIDYLTLVGESAPVRDLELCLGSTLEEFNDLLAEIQKNKKLIEAKQKRINQKLGVVTHEPTPPPKLVDKSPVYYFPPPQYRRNQHQPPRPRGRPRRPRSPEQRKLRPVTKVNNDDIDSDSGHTHMISMDGSIHSTNEPKRERKPKRKGRRVTIKQK